MVLALQRMQCQAECCHGLTRCEPARMLLQRPDAAFRTALACGCADHGGRTGHTPPSQCLLQPLGHLLPARSMPQAQALRAVLAQGPQGATSPWAERLPGCQPRPLLGRLDASTRRRALIPRAQDGPLPRLARRRRRPLGPPPPLNLGGAARPLRGFGARRMPLPRGGQQRVRTPHAQDPARRRAATAMAPPGPHRALAGTRARRRRHDTTARRHQGSSRTGPTRPSLAGPRRGLAPLPVDGGACEAPHTTDTRPARGLHGGGRHGRAHRLALLGRTGRSVSSQPLLACHSALSRVDAPSC
jgi:hypothetical protein